MSRDRVPGKPAPTVTFLLLIIAAHVWPNMIKVCAVSLKTHLSSVDLNFFFLYFQASEIRKTVYREEFVVAGIR